MKSNLTLLFIITLLLFAHCTPKLGQDIAQNVQKEPESAVPLINRTAEEFEKGKMLMTQGCRGCHILFDPVDFTVKEWGPILDSMIPKARLSAEESALVRDYIIAHSKDYDK